MKKLVWLKDGMDISNNPDYKTEFLEESQAKLSIEEVFHEDSAIFTCRAIGGENDSVVVETSGKLTVRGKLNEIYLKFSSTAYFYYKFSNDLHF